MNSIQILPLADPRGDHAPEAMALRLAALSHPARLRILRHLSGKGACCCAEVVQELDLAQSTVSQHLKVLVDAGLVLYTPENRRSRYTVNRTEVNGFAAAISAYLAACGASGCCG